MLLEKWGGKGEHEEIIAGTTGLPCGITFL